jgi:hypothetical protein
MSKYILDYILSQFGITLSHISQDFETVDINMEFMCGVEQIEEYETYDTCNLHTCIRNLTMPRRTIAMHIELSIAMDNKRNYKS